jgi:hypothetical protein
LLFKFNFYRYTKESAGVLVSKDEGESWQAYGFLTHLNTTLIEGSLAELNNGTVIMVFRTTVGRAGYHFLPRYYWAVKTRFS